MKTFVAVVLLLLSLAACAPSNPNLVVRNPAPPLAKPAALPKPLEQPSVHLFSFARSEAPFDQAKYDENVVSVHFQVKKDGQSVNDLKARDLRVQENGAPITSFKLDADKERLDQVVDIVFAVDITGTMTAFIETAKRRLAAFVESSHKKGYHTRMCISTFGDYTVKNCQRFFDVDPKKPFKDDPQIKELLNELAHMEAYKGQGKDPGWPDLDENPMRALIDASSAPWAQGSQRFLILVTDWGFLYSPDNQGTIGEKAPHMSEVTQAIKSSGMTVFAVTPNQQGYNSPFQNEPSIVQASGGEFFEFKSVMAGKISLDHILSRILIRINTTYSLSYVVDRVPGLDPTLPVEKRQVTIATAKANGGTSEVKSITSSIPTGRPQYQQAWKIADSAVAKDSLKVFVDGKAVAASEYSLNQGEVTFKSVPRAGAKLRFVFYYEALEKNFRMEPMTFAGDVNAENSKVYLNDKEARPADFSFTKDLEGNMSLKLADTVMASDDPYDLRKNKSLKVKVVRVKQ